MLEKRNSYIIFGVILIVLVGLTGWAIFRARPEPPAEQPMDKNETIVTEPVQDVVSQPPQPAAKPTNIAQVPVAATRPAAPRPQSITAPPTIIVQQESRSSSSSGAAAASSSRVVIGSGGDVSSHASASAFAGN